MSVTATILDLFKIKKHSSFLGQSIFKKRKKFIITESTGKGNCDILNKKNFFIVTGIKYKLMLIYFKKKLEPIRLYDIINDPREFKNIIKDKSLRKSRNYD